jgi:alkylated DNA repair dioxygenase AlkB
VPGLTADTGGRSPQILDIPEAEVSLYPAFFSAPEADRLLQELRDTTAWRQETIKLYGKTIEVPRLTAWYCDEGTSYIYSGIKNVPLPWTPVLREIKQAVEPPAGVVFNSVLLNRYRTGQDSVSWHADDEPEFGDQPVIASVSFGGTRTFQFKHKKRKEGERRADARQPADHARQHAGELAAPDPKNSQASRGATEPHVSGDRDS